LSTVEGFGQLRRLEIRWLFVDAAALRQLMKAAWFGQLQRIWFALTPKNTGVAVAGLTALPDLHTLELSVLPTEGLAAFAKIRSFPALGRLFLKEAHFDGEGAGALGKAGMLQLANLTLIHSRLRNDDVTVLAKSGLFAKLRVVSLGSNAIGDKGVAAIADSPSAANLRVLRLGDNSFGKKGLDTLARPGAFPNLTTLDLHSSLKRKATPADLVRFLTELHLPQLRHLDLTGRPLDDAGARALAGNPTFANLTCLDLGDCQIGTPGAAALFASPPLQHLVQLNLRYNKIGKAAAALQDRAVLPRLGKCDLPSEGIPPALRKQLERARTTIFI
jgi:hypothetical protein